MEGDALHLQEMHVWTKMTVTSTVLIKCCRQLL